MGMITGTIGNDVLIGSDLEADVVAAYQGADIINGGMGADRAYD